MSSAIIIGVIASGGTSSEASGEDNKTGLPQTAARRSYSSTIAIGSGSKMGPGSGAGGAGGANGVTGVDSAVEAPRSYAQRSAACPAAPLAPLTTLAPPPPPTLPGAVVVTGANLEVPCMRGELREDAKGAVVLRGDGCQKY